VPINWFWRLDDVRPDIHDPKSSLLRTSESILRVVGYHAALLLRRTWLGNIDQRGTTDGICCWCTLPGLGNEWFGHILDCSLRATTSLCCKSSCYAGKGRFGHGRNE